MLTNTSIATLRHVVPCSINTILEQAQPTHVAAIRFALIHRKITIKRHHSSASHYTVSAKITAQRSAWQNETTISPSSHRAHRSQ